MCKTDPKVTNMGWAHFFSRAYGNFLNLRGSLSTFSKYHVQPENTKSFSHLKSRTGWKSPSPPPLRTPFLTHCLHIQACHPRRKKGLHNQNKYQARFSILQHYVATNSNFLGMDLKENKEDEITLIKKKQSTTRIRKVPCALVNHFYLTNTGSVSKAFKKIIIQEIFHKFTTWSSKSSF